MIKFSEQFNENADRRQQELDFVGKERRKLVKAKFEREELNRRTQAFLDGLHTVRDIKRVS